MSKQIDERVVEMRFDNKQFESNVKTSMSTLDKLKQKLQLKDASKGLDSLGSAAKKVDLNPLGRAAETVTAKFSALQVIGVTALANITNSAVNAGKNIISALTIDPVKTGFQEYTTQLTATQSILANVGSKGKTIEDVNAALDELNKYADQTIYNFTEMTRNIGYFTTAGVDLEQSVTAIKGFSNAAALAGADATKTAGAMYQLSQAMSSGKMLLTDWRSLETAGIAGEKFRESIMETARVHGISIDAMIEEEGSFRDTLKSGWLTNDIMIESLEKFTMATDNLTDAEKEANREKLRSIGYTEEQIDSIFELGQVATDSATKIKDIGQMWDVIKEAAQSGWAQTWRLIFGNVEQAKALFTPLTKFFTNIIEKMSDARNKLLDGALGKSFKSLSEKISGALKPIEKTSDAIEKVTGAIKDYGKIVDEIILGNWGNGQERFNKLAEAGYDWAHAQNLVNERLNDSTRYATDYKETQDGLNDAQEKAAESQTKLTASDAERIEQLVSMSEAQLKNLGYTDEQIAAFKELRVTADKLGLPLSEFINNMDEINGRWLLINSFKNIGQGIVKVITSIKDAWRDIFPATTAEQLFNVIAGFHKFTTHLIVSDETANKVKKTFKGLFAALDLVRSVIGGALGMGFRVLKEVLSSFNLDILDVTANVGDAIVKFRDWVKEHNLLGKAIQFIVPYIKEAVAAVSQWIKNNEAIQNGINNLRSAFNNATKGLRDWVDNIKEADNIPKYIISGLVNGIKNGASLAVEAIVELGKSILEGIKGVLGIHSPSTKFFEIGSNMIAGLINGLKAAVSALLSFIGDIGHKCIDIISKIDFGKVFTLTISAGIIYSAKKLYELADKFAAPLEGLGKMFGSLGKMFNSAAKVLDNFSGMIKVKKYEAIAKMFLNLGIAIGIMAASVWVLSNIPEDKLWNAVKAVGALAAIFGVLAFAMNKISGASASIGKDGVKISGVKTTLISLGIALLLMAKTVKMLGTLTPDEATHGFIGLAGLVAAIGLVLLAFGKLVKGKSAQNINKFGAMLLKMSGALLLLTTVVKLIGRLSLGEMGKGTLFLAGFLVFINLFSKIANGKDSKSMKKVSDTLLKISGALLLMVVAVKLIGRLSLGEIVKGTLFLTGFLVFIKALMKVTEIGNDKQIAKISGLLLAISGALILMALACKLIGTLSIGGIGKGVLFVAGFLVFIKYLVKFTTIGNKQQIAKVAATILAMSVAIGILAAVSVLLGLVDLTTLAKGVAAVTFLGLIMTAMIWATKGAEDVKGNIIAMIVAIGVIAASVALLSSINPGKLAGATTAMGILMSVFAVMLKLAGSAQASIGSLIVMTVAVGLLAGIIYLLSSLPIESVLSSAASLSILLLSLSASLAILSVVGVSIGTALAGALGLLALCVPLAAFVGILALMQNIQNAEANANILISLMTTMTGMLTVVSLLGPLALIGVGAINAMIIVMTAIAGLVVAIGALNEKFPQLETFVDSGISLLIKLANGLGQVIGNFVSGFAQGIASGLPEIATNLSTFMTNLEPFISGAKMIDESTMNGIKALAETILILTGAGILEGIASWVSGGSSLTNFANQLAPFGKAIKAFADEVVGIDGESVISAANAGKLLSEMAKSLPREGGWIDKLIGGKDLSSFSDKITSFGKAIKSFAQEVVGIDEESVTSAANAGKVLAEMAKSLPREGGWINELIGGKDISSFGSKLSSFGKAIKSFSEEVAGVDSESVTNAANSGKVLSEMAKSLPREDGWWQKIVGGKDLSSFSDKITSFGKAIKSFSQEVSGINTSAISNASSAIKEIINIAKSTSGADLSGLSSFNSSMSKLGKSGVNNFIKAFSDSSGNAVNAGRNLVSKVVEGIRAGLPMLNMSFSPVIQNMLTTIMSKQAAFSNAGQIIITNFANSFNAGKAKAKATLDSMLSYAIASIKNYYIHFAVAGLHLVNGFAKGISDNTFIAEAKARAMANKAYEAAKKALDERSPSKKFMKVGAFVVAGFAKGITKNVGDATKAAVGMSNGVLEATQDALGIHSPSVVFDKEVGRYVVQGIAEGIKKDMSAEEAAEKKAQNIVSAFQNELDRIERRISNRDKGFNLWKLTDGKAASDAAIVHKQMQQLNDDLYDYNEKAKLAKGEWETFSEMYGSNSKYTEEAYGKMLDAQIKAAETAEELIAVQDSLITSEEELAEKRISINKKKAELLESQKSNGKLITDAEIDNANLSAYKIALEEQVKMVANAQQKYDKLLNDAAYGPNHKETLAALDALMDARSEEENAKAELFNYEQFIYDRNIEKLEDQITRNESENELWELIYGENASNKNRYIYYKNQYEEDANNYHQAYRAELKRYNDFVKDYAEKNYITVAEAQACEEAKKQWDKVREAQIKAEEARKKVRDNRKEYLENEREDLETQYELTSDIADLKYQIWEKTNGRKATDVEKNTMKLAFLSEQVGAQAKLVKLAKEAWSEATGDDKQQKEKEYYQAQLELANLQSEVLDIQEENIKRQEKALDKQRNSYKDYEDYIKKYEKYYLEHGMTKEELEKDARLVSGYDPNNAVKSMVSKTTTALNNLKNNTQYNGLLSSFSEMGTSYASAVSDGIQNGTTTIVGTTSSLVKACVDKIDSEKDSWVKAGTMLVEKFIEGIKSKIQASVDTATELASRTLEAIRNVCDGNMDYSPTIRPVLDMSDVSSKASSLNSIFSANRSLKLATSIPMSSASSSNSRLGSTTAKTSGATYSFVQNNYSPKALSSIEIYRQTNNVISKIGKKVT